VVCLNKVGGDTTLIEVLVSLLVLSGAMLGIAAMQSVSLRSNQSAYYRTQATTFTVDIAERMRANLAAVLTNGYNNADGAATAACFTILGCTAMEMAAQDIREWSAAVVPSAGVAVL